MKDVLLLFVAPPQCSPRLTTLSSQKQQEQHPPPSRSTKTYSLLQHLLWVPFVRISSARLTFSAETCASYE